ncbi:MAG: hypothetical protein PVS2B3_08350 [Steroidobacteraceae bacterium]
MRVAFAGTPEFALPALAALIARHEVVGVLTQPDRPAGRGKKLKVSPVKAAARAPPGSGGLAAAAAAGARGGRRP